MRAQNVSAHTEHVCTNAGLLQRKLLIVAVLLLPSVVILSHKSKISVTEAICKRLRGYREQFCWVCV